jgi:hypothetical protein
MRIHWRLASVALLLLPLVAMGCASSTVIEPGNGQLTAELLPDPAAGPRDGSKPPFVWAKADVTSVTFHPADPDWSISLGPNPLRIVGESVKADLATAGAQELGTVTITKGPYQLDKIFVTKFELNTSNEPPIPGVPRCEDGALEFAEFLVSQGESGIVPSSQPLFDVIGDTPRVIHLTMDGSALTALLESHVTCVPGSTSATVTPVSAAELSSLITVQVQ